MNIVFWLIVIIVLVLICFCGASPPVFLLACGRIKIYLISK